MKQFEKMIFVLLVLIILVSGHLITARGDQTTNLTDALVMSAFSHRTASWRNLNDGLSLLADAQTSGEKLSARELALMARLIRPDRPAIMDATSAVSLPGYGPFLRDYDLRYEHFIRTLIRNASSLGPEDWITIAGESDRLHRRLVSAADFGIRDGTDVSFTVTPDVLAEVLDGLDHLQELASKPDRRS